MDSMQRTRGAGDDVSHMGTFNTGAVYTIPSSSTVRSVLQSLGSRLDTEAVHVDTLQTLCGSNPDLGTYTGSFLSANLSVPSAVGELELEARRNRQTLGVDPSATHMGSFTAGAKEKYSLPESLTVKGALQHIASTLDTEADTIDTISRTLGGDGGLTFTAGPKGKYSLPLSGSTIQESLQHTADELDLQAHQVDKLQSLSGMSEEATTLSSFTGSSYTLPASTIDATVQSLSLRVDRLQSLSGKSDLSSTLGGFEGATIPAGATIHSALQVLEHARTGRTATSQTF